MISSYEEFVRNRLKNSSKGVTVPKIDVQKLTIEQCQQQHELLKSDNGISDQLDGVNRKPSEQLKRLNSATPFALLTPAQKGKSRSSVLFLFSDIVICLLH